MNEKALEAIEKHREAILLGEIAALLHDFGKCSSDFIGSKSVENDPSCYCHEKEGFSDSLVSLLGSIEVALGGFKENLRDLKEKHGSRGNDGPILNGLIACDRLNSADDKGVVRRKQHFGDTHIATPFGYSEQLDPGSLDCERASMDQSLLEAFNSYSAGQMSIQRLRESVLRIVKPGFSKALGETRIPANDVTLWEHSYGVAAMYKPLLASFALGETFGLEKNGGATKNNTKWRLFGIGWNGLAFVQRGKKPADILKRSEILRQITNQIQTLLEVTYPAGNLFYEDVNGPFFTYPGIDDEPKAIAVELGKMVLSIVEKCSDKELWPFFTLSKPSRTLTMITGEIKRRNVIATAPKASPSLHIGDGNGTPIRLSVSPSYNLSEVVQQADVCPICQLRPAGRNKSEPICEVCASRREGRLASWLSDQGDQTIWLTEASDCNNRVALLTLRLDLSAWLSGGWFRSIWSQTLNDWQAAVMGLNNQQLQKVRKYVGGRIEPTAGYLLSLLTRLFSNNEYMNDRSFKSQVLNTMFEGSVCSDKGGDDRYIDTFYMNLLQPMGSDQTLTEAEKVAIRLFTQHPSPGRLYRIWNESQNFFGLLRTHLESEVFASSWSRLSFELDDNPPSGLARNGTYYVTSQKLGATPLFLLFSGNRKFTTIDSLQKFKSLDAQAEGIEAVRKFVTEGDRVSFDEEDTGKLIPENRSASFKAKKGTLEEQTYCPFIELAKSPLLYQVVVPASSIPRVLAQVRDLYRSRFKKVQGKLPLHTSVLVANRKFPLYAMLEAGDRILADRRLGNPRAAYPWWDTSAQMNDDFYGYYPQTNTTLPDCNPKLEDLKRVTFGERFALTPGYFDFDLLQSTADRNRLFYGESKDDRQVARPDVHYGSLFKPRPMYFHQIDELMRIWQLLSAKLTTTQLHSIEEALIGELREWESLDCVDPDVFHRFASAVLQDAFGDGWRRLEQQQQDLLSASIKNGLLLDCFQFFLHVIKER